jgi:hypothetical protein
MRVHCGRSPTVSTVLVEEGDRCVAIPSIREDHPDSSEDGSAGIIGKLFVDGTVVLRHFNFCHCSGFLV